MLHLHKGKEWLEQFDQNYCDCVRQTCDFIAFQTVASKMGLNL